jgi:hypothetical protein
MADVDLVICHRCGQQILGSSLIVTEQGDADNVRVWRLCGWTCAAALAEENRAVAGDAHRGHGTA